MLNIVIPMASPAGRFPPVDFPVRKTFISMNGLPIVELVIRNQRSSRSHRFIFICHQEHLKRYHFKQKLQRLVLRCKAISLSGLAAQRLNDSHLPLMIASSEQWVDSSIDTKWSCALRDEQQQICEVAKNQMPSVEATLEVYNFCRSRDLCFQTYKMMTENGRCWGEYFVAPVYTRLYQGGQTHIDINQIGTGMYDLCTQTGLAFFLNSDVAEMAVSSSRGAA